MGKITNARAWANNEVAFIAWDVDGKIDGCLGFEVTRVILNERGPEERIKCAAWVAFKGQHNPNWVAQDTGVWPVQKYSWRDLTVRKKRDRAIRRPDEVNVYYEIRPVGDQVAGLEKVLSKGIIDVKVLRRDRDRKPVTDPGGKKIYDTEKAYIGKERPLSYLGKAVKTDPVLITSMRGAFQSTFTNGIIAAQWLSRVLLYDGVIEKGEVMKLISKKGDNIRSYLAGDVLELIRKMFEKKGEFYLALYELEDEELVSLLVQNKDRIHLILSNSGADDDGNWDTRNSKARLDLKNAPTDIQNRMFNNSGHIGHNKFVVHVPPNGGKRSVLTGSTNWTSTGVAGQTNNAIIINDDNVAGKYLEYWKNLQKDKQPEPRLLSAEMKENVQGRYLRDSDKIVNSFTLDDGSTMDLWFSPNTDGVTKGKKTPPDLAAVYNLMRHAHEAILFLAFYPGQSGNDCIIGEAVALADKDPTLIVTGAVSSPQAMPNYVAAKRAKGTTPAKKGKSPSTYITENVSIVRASKIDDDGMFGDFRKEQLTALNGIGAIIHDKIVVIDPKSENCVVIFGSHNLGYKASYCNDENLVIVKGNKLLAEAYAVHILDVYDHYRFRAVESERARSGKTRRSGFLDTTDKWQDPYISGEKGALTRYMAAK